MPGGPSAEVVVLHSRRRVIYCEPETRVTLGAVVRKGRWISDMTLGRHPRGAAMKLAHELAEKLRYVLIISVDEQHHNALVMGRSSDQRKEDPGDAISVAILEKEKKRRGR